MTTQNANVKNLFIDEASFLAGSIQGQKGYDKVLKKMMLHNDVDDTIVMEWSDDTKTVLIASNQTITGQKTFEEKLLFGDDISIGNNGTGTLEILANGTSDIDITSFGDMDLTVNSGNLNINSDTILGGDISVSAEKKLTLAAGTTGQAPFKIPEGVAPTIPENGDMWITTTDIIARINGSNVSLIPDTSGLVDTTTNQTIGGEKTFSDPMVVSDDFSAGGGLLTVDQSTGKVGLKTNAPIGEIGFGATNEIYMSAGNINCDGDLDANGTMGINLAGYNNGFTQFRDFVVYNGKAVPIFTIDGSEGSADFSGDVTIDGDINLADSCSVTIAGGILDIEAGNLNGMRLESYDDMNLYVNSGNIILGQCLSIEGAGPGSGNEIVAQPACTMKLAATNTTRAPLNVPQGTAPSVPLTDDIYNDGELKLKRASATHILDAVQETETFTVTLTGVSGSVTGTARYQIVGDFVHLYLPDLTGLSNSTSCGLTGIPSAIYPVTTNAFIPIFVDNSQTTELGSISIDTGGVTQINPDLASSWVNDNDNKGIFGTTITYRIA